MCRVMCRIFRTVAHFLSDCKVVASAEEVKLVASLSQMFYPKGVSKSHARLMTVDLF